MKKFIERYIKYLHREQDVLPIVLKGHLLLESLLDQIIEAISPNPQYIQELNLMFYKKVLLARAMSWDKHEIEMWELIIAINSLRNELAHHLEGSNLENKIQNVLQKFHDTRPQDEMLKDHANQQIEEKLKLMIVYLAGFLNTCLSDAIAYRSTVNSLYETIKKG